MYPLSRQESSKQEQSKARPLVQKPGSLCYHKLVIYKKGPQCRQPASKEEAKQMEPIHCLATEMPTDGMPPPFSGIEGGVTCITWLWLPHYQHTGQGRENGRAAAAGRWTNIMEASPNSGMVIMTWHGMSNHRALSLALSRDNCVGALLAPHLDSIL